MDRLAKQHDKERLTTADFTLMFSGLENQCTADELVAALSTELSELGFDENKIAYIEVRPSPPPPSTSPTTLHLTTLLHLTTTLLQLTPRFSTPTKQTRRSGSTVATSYS